MQLLQFSLLFGLILAASPPSVKAESTDTWTSINGTQQLHGRPVAFDGDLILFETSDGKFRWAAARHFCSDDQTRLATLRSDLVATDVKLNVSESKLPLTAVRIGGTNAYDVIKTDASYVKVATGTYSETAIERNEFITTGLKARQRKAARQSSSVGVPVAANQSECCFPTYNAPQIYGASQHSTSPPCDASSPCCSTPIYSSLPGNTTQNDCGGCQSTISYPTASVTQVIPESPLANRPPMRITIPYTVQRIENGQIVEEKRSITRDMTQKETMNYLIEKLEQAQRGPVGNGNLSEKLDTLEAEIFGLETNRSVPLEKRIDRLESMNMN